MPEWREGKVLCVAYIWVVSDLLDDRLIKVPRVSLEGVPDAIYVLDTLEDIGCYGELAALSKLGTLCLGLDVHVLHPTLVKSSGSIIDVVFEYDDVAIWDLNGVGG